MSGPETVSSASGGSQRIFGDPARLKAAEGQAGIYPIGIRFGLPNQDKDQEFSRSWSGIMSVAS